MQRRTSSRAPGDAVENRNLVDNSNPKTWQQRSWRYIKDTVIQDYDSVQSILINFGIVAALLLSILMTTMVSVPIEESVRGDILALSLSSAHFRCHFALPNADTIEICNPSFTVALFGTTNAADLCRDGPSMKPISGSPGYWSQFKCAGDIPRSIRGDDLTFWGQKTKAYGPGCSSSSFKEAYRVAENVTENAYLAYLIQELPATDQDGWSSWFGWPGTFNTCRPSGRLATLAFKSLLFLMFALFWDLYLLVSLTFSSASKRPTEMRLWWLSGGAVGALLVMGMLLNGTIHFLWSLEYLVMLRFPSPYDQLIYKIDFMDTFIFYGIWISLLVMGVHFLAVRFDWILVKIWQVGCRSENADNDAEHEQPSVVEIKQILHRKNRKLLLYAKLDVRRLLAFLNDNSLLNSVLTDAGIKSPGDRLEIIMILRTIDTDNRGRIASASSPRPFGNDVYGGLGYMQFAGVSGGSPYLVPQPPPRSSMSPQPQMQQPQVPVLQFR